MGGAVLGLGLLFLFGLINVLWPRGWWRVAEGWKYRNPEAVAPSDAAITAQRIAGGFLCGVAIVIPIWSASNTHQVKEAQRQEEAVAEAKATNRDLAERYRQTVIDEARRLQTPPRQVPVAVLEPQGIDDLSAVRRPDFATTGDVTLHLSAGTSSADWCVTFYDKVGTDGSIDERPCGYERGIVNRFAQEAMIRYRNGGTVPSITALEQLGLSSTPLLVVRAGRDPRTFTVRLDPIYGAGWCLTLPDTPQGTATIKASDCPFSPPTG